MEFSSVFVHSSVELMKFWIQVIKANSQTMKPHEDIMIYKDSKMKFSNHIKRLKLTLHTSVDKILDFFLV